MFELVVMPLTELWVDETEDKDELREALVELQSVLSRSIGDDITWNEDVEEHIVFEADGVDPYCIYGLRAAAAWLEFHDDLEGFEVGLEPWQHPIFDELTAKGHSDRFPHLLHSDDADCAAFVPADLPDVFALEDEEDEDELLSRALAREARLEAVREQLGIPTPHGKLDLAVGSGSFGVSGAEGEGEGRAVHLTVGSATRLRKELDELRIGLRLEEGLEEHLDDVVFDPAEDALAGPRYGWLVLSTRTNEAIQRGLPLILMIEDLDDESSDVEKV